MGTLGGRNGRRQNAASSYVPPQERARRIPPPTEAPHREVRTVTGYEYAELVREAKAAAHAKGLVLPSVVFKNRPLTGTRTVRRNVDGSLVFSIAIDRSVSEITADIEAALALAAKETPICA